MLQEKFTKLDDLAAPAGYAAPPHMRTLLMLFISDGFASDIKLIFPRLTRMNESLLCVWLKRLSTQNAPDLHLFCQQKTFFADKRIQAKILHSGVGFLCLNSGNIGLI